MFTRPAQEFIVKHTTDVLLEEIDLLRHHLYELGKQLDDLTNPRLVEVSQLLDKKLNFYELNKKTSNWS